jgi:hypothetical protein
VTIKERIEHAERRKDEAMTHEEKQIEEMAKDLLNISKKVSNIIMDETHEFISQKHKYKSLKDFHEAHPKGRNLIEAELLTELGYAKASDVAREIIDQIIHYTDTHKAFIARIPIQELIKFGNFLAELKKKYTESEGE